MRMNIIYQMLENLLAILGWNHVQRQRNGIGSLTSRTVIYLFYSILYYSIRRRFPRRCSLLNMQEFLLESLQDFRSQDGIAVGFSCLSAHCRSLLCQFYPLIIMGCSYQRHRGILRETRTAFSVIIPVTQTLFQYTATVLTLEIIHIAEHLRCIFLHHPVVAVMLLIKEWKRYQGTAPLWRFSKRVEPLALEVDILRSGCRNGTIGMLGIGDILHRLLYHRATVVVVYQSLAIEPILLQPTEFLTMRTVGPDSLPVTSDGTVDNLISTVKHRIRTFEVANLRS